MLKELRIENLALIDALHLVFGSPPAGTSSAAGLTVFTGETGAGKSIVLQAIGLLRGGKGLPNLIRTGADTATVEAGFELGPTQSELRAELAGKGIEIDDCLVIKRILARDGKSRFYLNGGLATARLAAEITENLLNIASQHDHQQLLKPRRHLDFIDTLGELWPARLEIGALHDKWTTLKARYQALCAREKDKEQRRDFLQFQCNEIREAAIAFEEDKLLQQEKERLKAADLLLNMGGASLDLLTAEVLDNLARVRKNLEKMAALDQQAAALSEEVAGCGYQLEEVAGRLRQYLDAVPEDQAQLETIMARIDLLQRLKRKYGSGPGEAGGLAAVLAYAEKGEKELAEFADLDQELAALAAEIAGLEEQLLNQAAELSAARRQTAGSLVKAMAEELGSLCFDNIILEVNFGAAADRQPTLADLTGSGWDRPEFMFSANPGEPAKPLAQIASGGELSRLMLAFKCLLARKDQVETVIFDEVDAGIGGKAAEAVAGKIKELAGHHQVLCITHLAQIAARADDHFLVRKSVVAQRTCTSITRLSPEQKVNELSRMLAGDSISRHTRAYAQEMLERNQQVQ